MCSYKPDPVDRTGPEGSHMCWVDARSRSHARALRLVNTPGMKADCCYLGVLAHKRDPFMSCQKQFKNIPRLCYPPTPATNRAYEDASASKETHTHPHHPDLRLAPFHLLPLLRDLGIPTSIETASKSVSPS